REAVTRFHGHLAPPMPRFCRPPSPYKTTAGGNRNGLSRLPVLVLRVPFLVPALDRFPPVLGRLPGRVRAHPVLPGAAGSLLNLVVLEAEPPALVVVHGH